jgi:hypothetical protein
MESDQSSELQCLEVEDDSQSDSELETPAHDEESGDDSEANDLTVSLVSALLSLWLRFRRMNLNEFQVLNNHLHYILD